VSRDGGLAGERRKEDESSRTWLDDASQPLALGPATAPPQSPATASRPRQRQRQLHGHGRRRQGQTVRTRGWLDGCMLVQTVQSVPSVQSVTGAVANPHAQVLPAAVPRLRHV